MWVAPSIAIRTEPTSDAGVAGLEQQLVRRAAGHDGRAVGADLGRRGDRLQRGVGRLLRGHRRSRRRGCAVRRPPRSATVRWVALLSLLDQVHRSVPLRTRSDSPSEPSSASRTWSGRRTRAAACATRRPARSGPSCRCPPTPGQARQPEVGVLDDGAGQAVEPGLLHVDEQLRGAAVRQPAAGARGDHADGGAADGEQRRRPGRGPASAARGRRSKTVMATIVRRGRCEIAENLWAPLSRRVPRWGHAAAGGRGRGAAGARPAARAGRRRLHRRRRRRRRDRARAGPARRLRRGAARRDAARGCPGTTSCARCAPRRTGCRC